MDKQRRKLVLATTSLPLGLALSGCGGGGDAQSGATAPADGRLAPQSSLPGSGGYIDIGKLLSNPIDSVFRSGDPEYLRYFQPVGTARKQAVLNTSSKTMFVQLHEVIGGGTPFVTHHRSVMLELPDFPPVGGTVTYTESTKPYKGLLVVNTTTDASSTASHYDYVVRTGGVKVVHTSAGVVTIELIGVGFLSLDVVDGAPVSSQTFSRPSATINLEAGSNKAQYPFMLTMASGRSISVTYETENGAWV